MQKKYIIPAKDGLQFRESSTTSADICRWFACYLACFLYTSHDDAMLCLMSSFPNDQKRSSRCQHKSLQNDPCGYPCLEARIEHSCCQAITCIPTWAHASLKFKEHAMHWQRECFWTASNQHDSLFNEPSRIALDSKLTGSQPRELKLKKMQTVLHGMQRPMAMMVYVPLYELVSLSDPA